MTIAHVNHRRLNDILTVIVIMFGIYLMSAPFIPQLMWKLDPPKLPAVISAEDKKPTSQQKQTPIPAENQLVIPRLGMREVINTGTTQADLNKGAWLVPNTSQPDKKSNTVIVGHRFTYAGPAVFYFLDKIQMGDSITVNWQGKEYTYKVNEIREVLPSEISVQDATPDAQLTLYTCTPLWTSNHRLVIVAPLEGVRS